MTTNTIEILAHLQDSPKPPGQTTSSWLDNHKDDVITLCQSKGITMVSDLLGLASHTIYHWRSTRSMTFKAPRLSYDGRVVLVDQDGKRTGIQRWPQITHGET